MYTQAACNIPEVNQVLESHSVYSGHIKEYQWEATDSVPQVMLYDVKQTRAEAIKDSGSVFGKYKPVALKVKPVKATLPQEFHVQRNITGDPLKGMPILPTNPPDFVEMQRYNKE
ncbi:hypothetical protein MPER_13219 [Moniliophthora perniciosa FA553]|nr:hypothetical protein MPER_13219 [Moniliophthora perniciosa FA553]